MHECIIQWIGESIEVVQVDASVTIAAADRTRWNFEGVECFSGRTWDKGIVRISDDSQQPIQAISSESLF
jgi:hypothetical protein